MTRYSYSPIPSDAGGVGGIICFNTEETAQVISERAAQAMLEALEGVPFALIYTADPGSDGRLRLTRKDTSEPIALPSSSLLTATGEWLMTWLDVFDRIAVMHGDCISIEDEQTLGGGAGDVLEALLDRYREEGYPGVNAELPADLLVQ